MDNQDFNVVNDTQSEVVDTQETEQVETTEQPVNAGTEEVTTSTVETKPVQSAEDNAKFADIRRRAESEARDKVIAEMNMEWNGQPITTYQQYQQALKEQEQFKREQAIRDEYESKGLPDELVEELVASKRDREERERERQSKAEQERIQAEYKEFFSYYKELTDKDYDADKDPIPQEVWQMVDKGKSLTDAYAIHHNRELKAKLKAFETNQHNSESSTGSVTGNGNSKDLTLTEEMVENMSPSELSKRWPEVKKLFNMK